MVVVGNVGWFASFTLMQFAYWRRRNEPNMFAPKLALGVFLAQFLILFIGGIAWGLKNFLIGLFAPLLIILLDVLITQIQWPILQAHWWQRWYQSESNHYKIKNQLMIQVMTLVDCGLNTAAIQNCRRLIVNSSLPLNGGRIYAAEY